MWDLIELESSYLENLTHSAKIEESRDKFLHLGPIHIMLYLKGGIDQSWTMLEHWWQPNYYREAISTSIYTLNTVQVNKGTNITPFELWYGYAPNVEYFKVFGRKFYILKCNRNGNLDAKSDEDIFLGYSTKRKTYKFLNYNTNKVFESENVKVDEYEEKN